MNIYLYIYIALQPCGPLRNPLAAFHSIKLRDAERKIKENIPKLDLAEMGETQPLTKNGVKLEMTREDELHGV
jgi:hypothetical protein